MYLEWKCFENSFTEIEKMEYTSENLVLILTWNKS